MAEVEELLAVSMAVRGGAGTAVLAGELTGETECVLFGAVSDVLAGGVQRLELDLSNVRFLDSGGISALLRLRDNLAAPRVQLTLLSPSGPVRQVLELTDLWSVFDVIDRG